ncbi:hypothetical protein DPMN_135623, partial [Dreissena polymorpha]
FHLDATIELEYPITVKARPAPAYLMDGATLRVTPLDATVAKGIPQSPFNGPNDQVFGASATVITTLYVTRCVCKKKNITGGAWSGQTDISPSIYQIYT